MPVFVLHRHGTGHLHFVAMGWYMYECSFGTLHHMRQNKPATQTTWSTRHQLKSNNIIMSYMHPPTFTQSLSHSVTNSSIEQSFKQDRVRCWDPTPEVTEQVCHFDYVAQPPSTDKQAYHKCVTKNTDDRMISLYNVHTVTIVQIKCIEEKHRMHTWADTHTHLHIDIGIRI